MTDFNNPLNEQELMELDEFLMSDQVSEDSMDIAMLDGFFTALIIGPRLFLPSTWLPWVWDSENGEQPVAFESEQQAQHIMDLLIRHMNGIGHTLLHTPDEYEPLMYESDNTYADGEPMLAADDWCIGFLQGVEFGEADWLPYLETHGELLAPIALWGTEDGMEVLDEMSEEEQRLAIESIAPAVLEMYRHWRKQGAVTLH